MSIDHSPTGPATRLHIKSALVSDEDIYLCETTFLDPLDNCDSSGAFSTDVKILGELFFKFFDIVVVLTKKN